MLKQAKHGFTLLEVTVAIAIIAVALTAVLSSQSQSISMASEAKFTTTAALLAQYKMAQLEAGEPSDLASDSGDFGEDFPGYSWELTLNDVVLAYPEGVSDHLKQIDLTVTWGKNEQHKYDLRLYRFVPNL